MRVGIRSGRLLAAGGAAACAGAGGVQLIVQLALGQRGGQAKFGHRGGVCGRVAEGRL